MAMLCPRRGTPCPLTLGRGGRGCWDFWSCSVLLQLACMSDVSVPVAAMIAALADSEPEERKEVAAAVRGEQLL